MKLLLNTANPDCQLLLVDDAGSAHDFSWPAGRQLARDLLAHIESALVSQNAKFSDLSGIGVFKGPGSFTGLRIGCTVANTIAHDLAIQIVAATGDDWQDQSIKRLENGDDDQVVMPLYDRPANVTKPKR